MEKRRVIAGVLALLWMCMIFAFSAQESEESSEVSGAFSQQIVSGVGKFFHLNLNDEELRRIANAIEKPVRKAAHMAEYAVLSVLIYIWLGKYKHAMVFATLYAASDELHQRFVPGRAGRLGDVLIDSAGAAIGVLIFIGVKKCIISLRNRHKYKVRESS
ncbi:MAG: VanZ family protein [Lachnospiraceae bacterium]|nr:VanZ family protein [Lachnospiraceae bacterium]